MRPSDWNRQGNLRRGTEQGISYEEHYLVTKDNVKIHTWLLLHDEDPSAAPRPTLIYFHGNAGNMGFRLPNAAKMFHYAKINVLMVDYRGYGHSEGRPTEAGLQADAEACLSLLRGHSALQGSKVVVFGRSLGGAVALYLAKRFPGEVAGVVVENTFLSISAMTDLLMPIVRPLKPLLLRMFWDNEAVVADVEQPILFISGDRDELVPPAHMRKLHEVALRSKHRELFRVASGGHNDTFEKAGMAYYLRLQAFIDQHVLGHTAEEVQAAAATPEEVREVEEGGAGAEERRLEQQEVRVANEEEEYLMVHATSIPTMGTDFTVR